jgi:hypothetical protein
MSAVTGVHPSVSLAEEEPSFEIGGPAYRLMQRIGIIQNAGPSVLRRSVCFVLATWCPLLLFCLWEGNAIGPTPRSSLLLDFAAYARLFVAVPLIFAAESLVGPRLRAAGRRFIEGELIHPECQGQFLAAVARVQRRRESALPEVGLAIFALAAAWFVTLEQLTGIGLREASWGHDATHLLPAGLWYRTIAVPLIQFFALRWIWHWLIWGLFLREVSRLRLNLLPTHTDLSAGLGFLGTAHVSMAVFPFAISCIIAAELAFRIQFEGMTLAALQALLPLLLAYLLFVEILIFGPLVVFVPVLAKARRDALRSYGMLVQHHNQLFHDKWITDPRSPPKSPLGDPDMSSLVDLGSSFAVIREMNIVPASRRQMLQVAAVACLPGIPLIFLALPILEVTRLLLGVLA